MESEIIWYPALPDAPVLPFPSIITSSEWDVEERRNGYPYRTGPGEVWDAPRVRLRPQTKPAAAGKHVCGTREDFEQGAHYDPTLPPRLYRPDGLPTCCAPGRGVLLGPAPGPIPTGGLVWTTPAMSPAGGLVWTTPGDPPPVGFCGTYTSDVSGYPLETMPRDGPQDRWTSTGATLYGPYFFGPGYPDWRLSGPFGLYLAPPTWNGHGCEVFTISVGIGPPTATVCCAD